MLWKGDAVLLIWYILRSPKVIWCEFVACGMYRSLRPLSNAFMARIEPKLAFNEVKDLLSVKTLEPQPETDPCQVQLEPKYQ